MKSVLSRQTRIEFGYNLYKSMEDSPELTQRYEVATELEQKKKLKAMERKLKNVEFKQLKDSRKNEKLNEEYKKMKIDYAQELEDCKKIIKEYKEKNEVALNVAKKQQKIIDSLFQGEFCDEKNLTLNQGGNRIVEKYRAILEEATHSTTQKRLENTITQLNQDIEKFKSDLNEANLARERMRELKNNSLQTKRDSMESEKAAKVSEADARQECKRLATQLEAKGKLLDEAQAKLAVAEIDAVRGANIPLLDRLMTPGRPYREVFVRHAMACMATGASAEVSSLLKHYIRVLLLLLLLFATTFLISNCFFIVYLGCSRNNHTDCYIFGAQRKV